MKSVLILITEPLSPDGRSLEAARVAAGLAQLSDLKIHLLLQPAACSLLDDPTQPLHDYLDLLQQAGGQILISRDCPATQRPVARLGNNEIRHLEETIPTRIQI